MTTDINVLIANCLEVPKEFILKIREADDDGIVVILKDYRKLTLTSQQLEQAEQNLTTIPAPIDLSTPSHAQQLHDQTHPGPELADIVGLGRTSNDRLREAGITTIAQLLATKPEEIAAIVKQNVRIAADWLKQARNLLGD